MSPLKVALKDGVGGMCRVSDNPDRSVLILSAEQMMNWNVAFPLAWHEPTQINNEDVRIECTGSVCSSANLLRCQRRNILCWATLMMEKVDDLKLCEMVVPRNMNDSTWVTTPFHLRAELYKYINCFKSIESLRGSFPTSHATSCQVRSQ